MGAHLAHGPANRRRRVLETAAPLFVCEPWEAARGGVIVVHDVLGLTSDAEAACRRLAREGWLSIAPFLYHEHGAPVFSVASVAAARAELRRLPLTTLCADLAAAASYLVSRGCGEPTVIGFGSGGYLAALAASKVSGIGAAVAVSAVGSDGVWADAPPLEELIGDCPVPWLGTAPLGPMTDEAAWQRISAFLATA